MGQVRSKLVDVTLRILHYILVFQYVLYYVIRLINSSFDKVRVVTPAMMRRVAIGKSAGPRDKIMFVMKSI